MPDENLLIPELTIVPSRGGYFSRQVLENRSAVTPDLRGRIIVVYVQTPQSKLSPEEVQTSLKPLLNTCEARFVTLHGPEDAIATTIMTYASLEHATFVMMAIDPEEEKAGPVQEALLQDSSCALLTINASRIARA